MNSDSHGDWSDRALASLSQPVRSARPHIVFDSVRVGAGVWNRYHVFKLFTVPIGDHVYNDCGWGEPYIKTQSDTNLRESGRLPFDFLLQRVLVSFPDELGDLSLSVYLDDYNCALTGLLRWFPRPDREKPARWVLRVLRRLWRLFWQKPRVPYWSMRPIFLQTNQNFTVMIETVDALTVKKPCEVAVYLEGAILEGLVLPGASGGPGS